MKLYTLAFVLSLPPDFINKWGNVDFAPEDWQIEDGKLVLDLRQEKDKP